MFSLRPAIISGASGQRSAWFAPTVNEIFRPSGLGADPDQEWYSRAKREVAQFDGYVERLRRLANRQVREDLWKEYVGDPGDSESGAYRRNTVAYHISQVESYTPLNYKVFASDPVGLRARNRVTKLDSLNRSFKGDLDSAEATYGLLPEPQIIERIVEVRAPQEAQPAAPFPWVPVVIIGAAAIGGLALLGVFSGKK